MSFLVLLVIGGYAVYVMSPDERLKLARRIQGVLRQGAAIAHRGPEPFRDGLRARTTWAVVTGAVAAIAATAYFGMAIRGGLDDPQTLIGWGGNFGPLTTQGEWWRLGVSMFLHAGFAHLVVNIAGLAQVGIVVERMLGHAAFAVVFVAAGLLAGLESLSAQPMAVTGGFDGAVFGVYGLFIATQVWNLRPRTGAAPEADSEASGLQLGLRQSTESASVEGDAMVPGTIGPMPRQSLLMLVPCAAIFLLYHASDGLQTSELSGLIAGFGAGLALARSAHQRTTPLLSTAAAAAVAAVVILASAAMLRGIADVRPELARVVAIEEQTVVKYEKAVGQFKNGALSAQALAKMISQSIVPELEAARARLKAVNGVPPQHQPLVASAEEYFRLRDESWRLRADALRKSNMGALRAADRSERASLEALDKLRPSSNTP